MSRPPLGEQELAVLRFIAERGPSKVSEVAEEYGKPLGLARTTVLTMCERLRKKAYLTRVRAEDDGVFQYVATIRQDDLLRSLVASFTEKTLGGSLNPFVAYLVEDATLTDAQVAQLRRAVQTLEARKDGR